MGEWISLPALPRRAHIRAFAAASGLVCALCVLVIGIVVDRFFWGLFAGAACGVGLWLPGWVRPDSWRPVYGWWKRAARAYRRVARPTVLRIWYYAVITSMNRGGGALRLREGAPRWTPRGTLGPQAYQTLSRLSGKEPGVGLLALARWAIRSGRPWVLVGAVPYLYLLSAFETEPNEEQPWDIYTLY